MNKYVDIAPKLLIVPLVIIAVLFITTVLFIGVGSILSYMFNLSLYQASFLCLGATTSFMYYVSCVLRNSVLDDILALRHQEPSEKKQYPLKIKKKNF